METWFDELKDKINDFLNTATDEELEQALISANYEYYKNIDAPVLSMNSEILV